MEFNKKNTLNIIAERSYITWETIKLHWKILVNTIEIGRCDKNIMENMPEGIKKNKYRRAVYIMNKELKKLLEAVKDFNWTVTQEDGNVFDFGWYSPCGQDFHITVDTENDVGCFLHNLYSVYENFDVSSEAYLWLDSDGHGTNGAPYDMKDLYEDFEACESAIYDLWEYLRDLYEIAK